MLTADFRVYFVNDSEILTLHFLILGNNYKMMRMTKIRLPLTDLPTFESTSIWCSLQPKTEVDLRAFHNVFDRARAGIRFVQYISGAPFLTEEEKIPMKAAFLRAALMEFVGMEEVLPTDLSEHSISAPAIKINKTGNTLLILLREMRHLNLHIINSTFEHQERAAMSYPFGSKEPHHTTLNARIVPLADLEKLKQLRNAPLFDDQDLSLAISWLDSAQRAWGIEDVILAGFETFAKLIIRTYKPFLV
jgi:hypothetical protein